MAKARRSQQSGQKGARKRTKGRPARSALIVIAVLVLFAAALYGLFRVDASGPADAGRAPRAADDGAPPVDHIDESSRDALEEILREESRR